jgi:sugar phosphate isomerase/epimerase
MSEPLSRRRFLQAGAAAAAGLAVSPLFAQEKKDDAFGGFTLGVQSYTFRNFDLEPTLKRVQELGLRHAEFYQKHVPMGSSPDQLKAILRLCGDYGVKPVAYGVQRFTKDHDANKKTFEFGKALGITTFSADPEPDSFDSLDKLCAEYKIAIAIHPHGPVGDGLHRWYSAEVILAAVKDHHPLIGTCLDTGHLIRSAQPPFNKKLVPENQVRVMKDRNFGMHLKDHDNERKTDVVFGKGVLNVPEVLKALREVKFKGYISIEYEANPDDPSRDVKACVDVFKGSVKTLG